MSSITHSVVSAFNLLDPNTRVDETIENNETTETETTVLNSVSDDPPSKQTISNTSTTPNTVHFTDATIETARQRAASRNEQKFWEKTKGNRQKEVLTFVTNEFAESHLQQETHQEIILTAMAILKISNSIEQKQRTQRKFEDALLNNPDLPFIPRSASQFTLAASTPIMGTKKIKERSLRMDLLRNNYNKEISAASQDVGAWKLENLFYSRTNVIISQGLTLAKALTLEFAYNNSQLFGEADHIKELPALIMFDIILTHITPEFKKYLNCHNLGFEVEIQNEIKDQLDFTDGNFDFKRISNLINWSGNEATKIARQKVKTELQNIFDIITFKAWNYIINMQKQTMRLIELKSSFEKNKIMKATRETDKILNKEKAVSQRTLEDLVTNTVDSKFKKFNRKNQKNYQGGARTQTPRPSQTGHSNKRIPRIAVQQSNKPPTEEIEIS